MDIMKLTDIFFFGVPETSITIFIALRLLSNKIGFKEKEMYIKLILSNIMILSIILFSRSLLSSIIYIALSSMAIYTLSYKHIWDYNWRQSVFAGSISIFLIMSMEIMTFPLVNWLINTFQDLTLLGDRLIVFIPTRVVHIFILILVIKYNITLRGDHLIASNWKELSRNRKIIIITFITSILLCVIINTNYTDLYVKAHISGNDIMFRLTGSEIVNNEPLKIDISGLATNPYVSVGNDEIPYIGTIKAGQTLEIDTDKKTAKLDTPSITLNMNIFYYASILIILTTLILLFRTIKNEEYREILRKTPEQFIKGILENSSYEELNNYTEIFLREIQVAKIDKLQKYCEYIKGSYSQLSYKINDNIIYADIDYTTVMDFVERFIHQLRNYDKNVYFEVNKEDGYIVMTLEVVAIDEIKFKAIESNYKKMTGLKKTVVLEYNAMISLNYQSNDHQVILKINIPIHKYFGKEDVTNEKK